MNNESDFISPQSLALRLGKSVATIYRWEKAGRLPKKYSYGPNSVGFLRSDIEAWLNNITKDNVA